MAFLDTASGELIGQVPGRRTALLRFGEGFLWSMTADGTLEQIDPDDQEVVRSHRRRRAPGRPRGRRGLGLGHGRRLADAAANRREVRLGRPDPTAPANRFAMGRRRRRFRRRGLRLGRPGRLARAPDRAADRPRRAQLPRAGGQRRALRATVRHGSSRPGWARCGGWTPRRTRSPRRCGCVPTAAAPRSAAGSCGFRRDRTVWKFADIGNPSAPLASVELAGAGDELAYGDGALWATTRRRRARSPASTRARSDEDVHRRPRGEGHRGGRRSRRGRRGPQRRRRDRGAPGADRALHLQHGLALGHRSGDCDEPLAVAARVRDLREADELSRRTGAGRLARPARGRGSSADRVGRRAHLLLPDPEGLPLLAAVERAGHGGDVQVHDRAGAVAQARSDRPWRRRSRRTSSAWTRIGLDELCTSPGSAPMATRSRSSSTPPPRTSRPGWRCPTSAPCRSGCRSSRTASRSRSPRQARTTSPSISRRSSRSSSATPTTRARGHSGLTRSSFAARTCQRPMSFPRSSAARPTTSGSSTLWGATYRSSRTGALADRYGPPHRAGSPRFFVSPLLAIDYIALNAQRPLFSDPRLRRAVNFALDRRAIADTYGWPPADHYLPPGMPGYRNAHLYPAGRPDLARARALARGRGGRAVLHVCDIPHCTQWARIIRRNLAAIGIEVVVRVSSDPLARAQRGGARRHAADEDERELQPPLLPGPRHVPRKRARASRAREHSSGGRPRPTVPIAACRRAGSDTKRFERKLERIRRLGGREREAAAGALDLEIARAAPGAVLVSETYTQFFSARMGCQTFQPLYFGVDLAALCMREGG